MARSLVCMLALVVAACGSVTGASEEVRLVLQQPAYLPGETVRAQFINQSEDQVGYGACSLNLERRVGGGWVKLEPLQLCVSILYVLEPGETREVRLPLDATLENG